MSGGAIAEKRWALAIHGGAGVIVRGKISAEEEAAFRAGLTAALEAGQALLVAGGSALDAVEAAVKVLEDDPLFNAGRGSVFSADGTHEMDAAIMDGRTADAGAVTGVNRTRNPVTLARAVMDHSPHVMLAGEGANRFALAQGIGQAEAAWFFNQKQWDKLLKWRDDYASEADPVHRFGTVGAVALDRAGNLAAATSTGGITGKYQGRVGDTPLIGAGTYARNGIAAVSATGDGEYFIREVAARQLCDRIEMAGTSLSDAALATIDAVKAIGGDGGLIAVDARGEIAFGLRDMGMYRGAVSYLLPPQTALFADERI